MFVCYNAFILFPWRLYKMCQASFSRIVLKINQFIKYGAFEEAKKSLEFAYRYGDGLLANSVILHDIEQRIKEKEKNEY